MKLYLFILLLFLASCSNEKVAPEGADNANYETENKIEVFERIEMCEDSGNPSSCFYELAKELNDESICDLIKEDCDPKVPCYGHFYKQTQDVSFCLKMSNCRRKLGPTTDIYGKNSCVISHAVKYNDSTVCENLSMEKSSKSIPRIDCYEKVNSDLLDVKLCENQESKLIEFDCLDYLGFPVIAPDSGYDEWEFYCLELFENDFVSFKDCLYLDIQYRKISLNSWENSEEQWKDMHRLCEKYVADDLENCKERTCRFTAYYDKDNCAAEAGIDPIR